MSPDILCVDSSAKSYSGRGRVLSSATLRAVAGCLTFLVGRNGCGKSTLLRIAAGALEADAGLTRFKGRVITSPRWHRLAREGVCYLPDREILSPHRTVREQLVIVANRFRTGVLEGVITALDLAPLLGTHVGVLSTGERRRAELAMAMVRCPDCLLVDEPHRNIDPVDQVRVTAVLVALARDGCAVVVTGHEVEELLPVADRVVWCTDGTTYELGSPAEALRHWRFVQEYVGASRAARLYHGTAFTSPSS